jgi:3-phosphoinositide dependent protein kinase-1
MSFPRCSFESPKLSDFKYSDPPIGEGNFCSVHAAEWKGSSRTVALKTLPRADVNRLHKLNDVIMEMHALSRLDHPNLIRYYGSFKDTTNFYIVTELCDGGELWKHCNRCGILEIRAQTYFEQILKCTEYLHRMGIAHRDMKAENIYLSPDLMKIKIGDFGSARDFYNPNIAGAGTPSISRVSGLQKRHVFQHYVGSPNFMAPEAIENIENDEKSDIWSLGCLFYQVLVGIPPFVAGSEYLVFLRVKAMDLAFPSVGLSYEAIDLVKSIIVLDRHERPSIRQILDHPFMRSKSSQFTATDAPQKLLQNLVADPSFSFPAPMLNQYPFLSDRIEMIKTVSDWIDKSQPGRGTEILEHLDLSPRLLGVKSTEDDRSDTSD